MISFEVFADVVSRPTHICTLKALPLAVWFCVYIFGVVEISPMTPQVPLICEGPRWFALLTFPSECTNRKKIY